MFGILFLLLSICTGYIIVKRFLPEFFTADRTPVFMLVLPSAFTIGVIVSGVFSYALCVLSASTGKGMLYGTALSMAVMAVTVAVSILKTEDSCFDYRRISGKTIVEDFQKNYLVYCSFIILAIFLNWLFFYSFFYADGKIAAGYTVFSDFGPHVALIRSFSAGNNFPAQYPHFPDGTMRYHFMFQFYAGILEFLGLRIDFAMNIFSLLALLSFFSLLYVLAMKITNKPSVGILAIILFLFRSSFAIFTYLFNETGYDSFGAFVDKIAKVNVFIGNTPREDWGLWTINVYANQRHFGLGLSLVLVLVIAFLPLLKGIRITLSKRYWLVALFARSMWVSRNWKQAVFLGFLTGSATYFHGSCVVAVLGILAVMALFSKGKLDYAITAIITLIFSIAQNYYFSAGALGVSPAFQFGFIVPDPTVFNVMKYLVEVTGVLFPVVLAGVILLWKRYGGLFPAFLVPAVLTFTLSLSVDITVNHKFLIVSTSFLNIFAAYAVIWVAELFTKKRMKATGAIISGLLILLLASSGIVDTIAFKNLNGPAKSAYYSDAASDTVKWIRENTPAGCIFLSSWHVQSPVTLAGRFAFMGWPYFGWSAGHDTYGRNDQMKTMFASRNPEELRALVKGNGISYIFTDRELVTSTEFNMDEVIIGVTFPLAYINDEESFRIYAVE